MDTFTDLEELNLFLIQSSQADADEATSCESRGVVVLYPQVWDGTHLWGEIKQCKRLGSLRDFPLAVHCLDWCHIMSHGCCWNRWEATEQEQDEMLHNFQTMKMDMGQKVRKTRVEWRSGRVSWKGGRFDFCALKVTWGEKNFPSTFCIQRLMNFHRFVFYPQGGGSIVRFDFHVCQNCRFSNWKIKSNSCNRALSRWGWWFFSVAASCRITRRSKWLVTTY